ncbi:MAG: hypothetical protein ABIH01_02785 [Candidatus Omnitrophota bacterium]
MTGQKTTNILLFLIFLALLANLAVKIDAKTATAASVNINDAVTQSASGTPDAYLHVVSHTIGPVKVEQEYEKVKPSWEMKTR